MPTSFPLIPAVQTYAWGKPGTSSSVAQLASHSIPGFKVDQSTTYAELWMGTHPRAPSLLAAGPQGETLSEFIRSNPACVGASVQRQFLTMGQLPFLFKVLSVNKSLSIQAHPNKKHAEVLHKDKPDKYPDPNHKPEMAIALTPFEGLCGFRPKQEIVDFLRGVPEFGRIIGESLIEKFENSANQEDQSASLRDCFTQLMTCDSDTLRIELEALIKRAEGLRASDHDTSPVLGDLLLRLNSQFPGDVGCFVIFFLNHVHLQPGEAMFLEANLPHAYLSGDCIECMACSDNVVRAGLTPKFKDVSVLCEMLAYDCRASEETKFTPDAKDIFTRVYDPPVPDFTVARIELPVGQSGYHLETVDSASIFLAVEGEATVSTGADGGQPLCLEKGSVLFVAANDSVTVNTVVHQLLLFRAYCKL